MRKFKIIDIIPSFGIFLDEEIEAENACEAAEEVMMQICDNIGNYIDIEFDEIYDEEDEEDEVNSMTADEIIQCLECVSSYEKGPGVEITQYDNQFLLQKEDIDTLLAYIKELKGE